MEAVQPLSWQPFTGRNWKEGEHSVCPLWALRPGQAVQGRAARPDRSLHGRPRNRGRFQRVPSAWKWSALLLSLLPLLSLRDRGGDSSPRRVVTASKSWVSPATHLSQHEKWPSGGLRADTAAGRAFTSGGLPRSVPRVSVRPRSERTRRPSTLLQRLPERETRGYASPPSQHEKAQGLLSLHVHSCCFYGAVNATEASET